MFSELRSTLITSNYNETANRMPWQVVLELFSCCLAWQGGAVKASITGLLPSL